MINKDQAKRVREYRKSTGLLVREIEDLIGARGYWSQFAQGRLEPNVESFLRMKNNAIRNGLDSFDESVFVEVSDADVVCEEEVTTFKEFREYFNLKKEDYKKEFGLSKVTWMRYESGILNCLLRTFVKIRSYGRSRGLEFVLSKEIIKKVSRISFDTKVKTLLDDDEDEELESERRGKKLVFRKIARTPVEALRNKFKMSVTDFANLLEISQPYAVRINRGDDLPSVSLAKRMIEEARKLGFAVTLDEIYQNVVMHQTSSSKRISSR